MAIGKIIQMLLRSAGGKKAAAKLYKQARKGRGYRERPGLTSEGIPDMSMKDYRKFYGKDPRLDKSYMRATRKMEKDDRMAQLWDKRPDVIASRDAAQLADWKKYGSPSRAYFPHKSHGSAGVRIGAAASPSNLMKLKAMGMRGADPVRDLRKLGMGRRQLRPQMVRGEYPKPPRDAYVSLVGNRGLGYHSDSPFGFNPLKRQIASRLSRRDPGMARGLGRMEARKASALNTPGTPFEGRALRYEPPTTMRKVNPLERIKSKARFLKTRRQEQEFSYLQNLVEGGADPRVISEAAREVSPKVARLVLGKNWQKNLY